MLNGFSAYFGLRPQKQMDGPVEVAPRGNGYGESIVQQSSLDGMDVALGESSFISGSVSGYAPGTTSISAALQTAFSTTSALLRRAAYRPSSSRQGKC